MLYIFKKVGSLGTERDNPTGRSVLAFPPTGYKMKNRGYRDIFIGYTKFYFTFDTYIDLCFLV